MRHDDMHDVAERVISPGDQQLSPTSRLVLDQLEAAATSWSIGMLGAVGEFHHGPAQVRRLDAWTVGSDLGSLRVRLRPDAVLVAYEMLSADPDSWHHGVAICLPEQEAVLERCSVVTEIGMDSAAIHAQHRGGVLFDLGLNSMTCRFCVRLTEATQIAELRSFLGRSLLDCSNGLFRQLQQWSPHRVLLSRAGRIEVCQRIGRHDEATPFGPHTHLIPALLRSHIPHSSYVPVPAGHSAVMTFYPANPVRDPLGRAKPFASEEHATFQQILNAFGDPHYVKTKCAYDAALEGTQALPPISSRLERLAMRISLRQAKARGSANAKTGGLPGASQTVGDKRRSGSRLH